MCLCHYRCCCRYCCWWCCPCCHVMGTTRPPAVRGAMRTGSWNVWTWEVAVLWYRKTRILISVVTWQLSYTPQLNRHHHHRHISPLWMLQSSAKTWQVSIEQSVTSTILVRRWCQNAATGPRRTSRCGANDTWKSHPGRGRIHCQENLMDAEQYMDVERRRFGEREKFLNMWSKRHWNSHPGRCQIHCQEDLVEFATSSRVRPHPLSRKTHGARTIHGRGKEKFYYSLLTGQYWDLDEVVGQTTQWKSMGHRLGWGHIRCQQELVPVRAVYQCEKENFLRCDMTGKRYTLLTGQYWDPDEVVGQTTEWKSSVQPLGREELVPVRSVYQCEKENFWRWDMMDKRYTLLTGQYWDLDEVVGQTTQWTTSVRKRIFDDAIWWTKHTYYWPVNIWIWTRLWGKRHSGRLLDMLRDEAEKRSSWDKNNVRMWGKRNYDDDDYMGYDWRDQDLDVYPKRQSPSSVSDVGQLIPKGWAKNAWERNNMRIWGWVVMSAARQSSVLLFRIV